LKELYERQGKTTEAAQALERYNALKGELPTSSAEGETPDGEVRPSEATE